MRSATNQCLAFKVLFLVAILGCNGEPTVAPVTTAVPPAVLRLVVIDDAPLAEALKRVAGEWQAQSGSKLEIQQEQFSVFHPLDYKLAADVVIYPTPLLGTLAEQRKIRPLKPEWLAADILNAAHQLLPTDAPEFCWDGQPYAISLGQPVFMLCYRPDLLERLGREPPKTWAEYQELAELLHHREFATNTEAANEADPYAGYWRGTIEPGPGPQLLLARAASYARHRDYFSVLFDRETMEPLIAGPPFVRALNELIAAVKPGWSKGADLKSIPEDSSPVAPIFFVLNGNAGMAIGWWDQRLLESYLKLPREGVPIAFAELPGSLDAYNPRTKEWQPRRGDEPLSATLRGLPGQVGSVVRGTAHPEAAFGLLTWLASEPWDHELLREPTRKAAMRKSQLAGLQAAMSAKIGAQAAKQFFDVTTVTLGNRNTIYVPRIPGQWEYMNALNNAMQYAVHGRATAQEALNNAAKEWREITSRLGKEEQLEAYRKSLRAAE